MVDFSISFGPRATLAVSEAEIRVTIGFIIDVLVISLVPIFLLFFFARRKLNPPVKSIKVTGNNTVVITGCSSGIGKDAAEDLALRGWTVFAGVRKLPDADALVSKIGSVVYTTYSSSVHKPASGGKIVPVVIDVTKTETIAAAVKIVSNHCPNGLGALVNNAGIIVTGPLEFLPLKDVRLQLDVNVIGQVDCTQQFLPLLRKTGEGARIVMMSSVAGKLALPFNGAYAASKFAVEALSDALRREVSPWGISVSVVEPSYVRTNLLDNNDEQMVPSSQLANKDWAHFYGAYHDNPPRANPKSIATAEVTSKAIAHALTSPKPEIRYVVGVPSMVGLFKIGTWMTDKYLDRALSRKSWPGRYAKNIPKN